MTKSVSNRPHSAPSKIPKQSKVAKAELPNAKVKTQPELPLKDSVEISKNEATAQSSEGENSDVVKSAISKATSVAKEGIKKSSMVPLPVAEKLNQLRKGGSTLEKSDSILVKKPGVFFIGGMGLLSGGYGGIREMSKSVSNAEHYHWDQQGKIIEEIKKRPVGEPIVLVGHSLGGDSAIEIAKELNTLPNGFRQVDLLVTLDAIGWNNDVIPPNVKLHENFISDGGAFLKGAPHIARDTKMTEVMNELRGEAHTDLDDSTDVQFKIFKSIQGVLGDRYSSTVESQRPSSNEITS